jgi:hypothetical protein
MADNIFTQEQQQQVFELFNAMGSLAKETDPLTQAHKEAAIAAKRLKDEHERLRKQFGDSALNFGKTLFSTGQGLGKFSSSIEGAAGAAGGLVKSFSGLGKAAGALGVAIQAIGSLVGAALRQNDQLMESYRNLSDIGSVAGGGLENLRNQLNRVGLISAEAEKFERALKPVTQQLSLLGGSVSGGREQFVNLINSMLGPDNEIERTLSRIGYSAQDIREGAADFMQRQARMGLRLEGNTVAQTRQVQTYLTTLKELQELTGMSRDEAQKALDMQLADSRMNMYLSELNEKERTNLQMYLAAYQKNFGAEAAAGLKEMIVNQGRVVGDLSAQTFQSTYGVAYQDAMMAMKQGETYFLTGLKNTANANYALVQNVRGGFMAVGEEMKGFTGNFQMINGSIQIRNMSEKDYIKQLEELKRTQAGQEGQLENSIIVEQRARSIRIAGDQAVGSIANLVTKAFRGLIEIMHSFGKYMAKFIDGLTNSSIGQKFGLTPTNLSAQFRDMDDNFNDLNRNSEEQLRTQRELVEINQRILDQSNPEAAKVSILGEISKLQQRQTDLLNARNNPNVNRQQTLSELTANQEKIKTLQSRLSNVDRITSGGQPQDLTSMRQAASRRMLELEQQRKGLIGENQQMGGQKIDAAAEASNATDAMRNQSRRKRNIDTGDLGSIFKFTTASGSFSNFQKLDSSFKQRLIAAASEYNQVTGKKVTINSAARAYEDQKRLWDESIAKGRKGFTSQGRPIADPDSPNGSKHLKGLAVDIQEYNDSTLLEIFKKHGLTNPIANDKVHFEMARTGGLFSGPESGYPVMLHGKEAVIRLDNLQKLLKNNQEAPADSTVSKSSITGELQNAMTSDNTGSKNDALIQIMSVAVDKLDQVVEHTRRNSQIQDELLTVARVK